MKLSTPGLYWASTFLLSFVFVDASLAASAESINLPATGSISLDILLLIAFISLALVFSFVCSVAESVLLSITPSYIESLREKQPKRMIQLKRLRLENVDKSLAAILTLNTIAHTVGSILAGAQATVVFGNAWVGLFSAVMTLMILFFSEIIPKTIGAVYWQKLVGVTVFFVQSMIMLLYPFVWISEGLTRLIARGKIDHVFSRDEFIAMAGIGERIGHIDEQESRIIRNLFRFGSLKATDIMTPRVVISAFPQSMTVSEALKSVTITPFSRLPVYRTDIDDITGFVLKDEILTAKSHGRVDVKLESLKRDLRVVPESMSLAILLEYLLDHRQHIVLVVDEYGGTKGLVTLEDVLETLLGMQIKDEMDDVEDMRVLARQQWGKRAKALGINVDEVAEHNQTKEDVDKLIR